MGKQIKVPDKYQVWIGARERFRLSHAHVQMARELGMNPEEIRKARQPEARTVEGAGMEESGIPVHAPSFEPGEDWRYCYVDESYVTCI
ncbi:MAG: hypothetical protein ACREXX_15960 [Gammaproteobacteria bacterium]